MATVGDSPDSWQTFLTSLDILERSVAAVKAVNVNAAGVRTRGKGLIQDYFRRTRPDLVGLGLTLSDLERMDASMQSLLQLANGRNVKRSYIRVLREIRDETQKLELAREYRLGEQRAAMTSTTSQVSKRRYSTPSGSSHQPRHCHMSKRCAILLRPIASPIAARRMSSARHYERLSTDSLPTTRFCKLPASSSNAIGRSRHRSKRFATSCGLGRFPRRQGRRRKNQRHLSKS
jgi:hypothetical protein